MRRRRAETPPPRVAAATAGPKEDESNDGGQAAPELASQLPAQRVLGQCTRWQLAGGAALARCWQPVAVRLEACRPCWGPVGICWWNWCCDPDSDARCFAWLVLLLSRLFFVPVVLACIAAEAFVFISQVLPDLLERSFGRGAAICVTGVFLLFNLLYNYGMVVNTDPGLPPEAVDEALAGKGERELKETDSRPRRCKKCLRQKPPRAHHCSTCRRCVLKMDHHCPWVNNCVGHRNYRYFCLFLLYLGACCLFVVSVFPVAADPHSIYGYLFGDPHHYYDRRHNFYARSIYSPYLGVLGGLAVPLCWSLAAACLLLMCCFGGFHGYLVLTNQTTIEFEENMSGRCSAWMAWRPWRSPWDVGALQNFRQVFGPSRLLWMLPCLARPPDGDGMGFPVAGAPPPELWLPCLARCCPLWALLPPLCSWPSVTCCGRAAV